MVWPDGLWDMYQWLIPLPLSQAQQMYKKNSSGEKDERR
jgi:hypothetical protein